MRKPDHQKRGFRPAVPVLAAVIISILGIVFLSITFLMYQRNYALEQADDLLLYEATLLAWSINAKLDIADLVLKNISSAFSAPGSPEDERKALAPAIFSIQGAENMYLLDGEGRTLFPVIQRRNPSLALPEDLVERFRSGVESDCLIVDAPAEGGKALVLIRVLRRTPSPRYAAVLFTRFEAQQRFTDLTPGSSRMFRLLDRSGNTLIPRQAVTVGSQAEEGGEISAPGSDLMQVNIALTNRPVMLQYFTDRNEVLRDWGFRAVIQSVIVFLFICLVSAILIFGLHQYRRASHAGQLEQDLKAQEVLVREVNHRTKNNLATIQAVLGLALRDVSGDTGPAANALKASISRIESISLVHDLLHRSAANTEIDLPAYIKKLVSTVGGLYSHDDRIGLETGIEPGLLLPYEKAMTCGMIINELVTNSYKYAFSGGSGGTIMVVCVRDESGLLRFSVSDDGRGFGPGSGSGTGMDLIRMLTQKLGAELSREDNTPSGTVWRFQFRP